MKIIYPRMTLLRAISPRAICALMTNNVARRLQRPFQQFRLTGQRPDARQSFSGQETRVKDARVVEAVNFAMKLVKFCPLFC